MKKIKSRDVLFFLTSDRSGVSPFLYCNWPIEAIFLKRSILGGVITANTVLRTHSQSQDYPHECWNVPKEIIRILVNHSWRTVIWHSSCNRCHSTSITTVLSCRRRRVVHSSLRMRVMTSAQPRAPVSEQLHASYQPWGQQHDFGHF